MIIEAEDRLCKLAKACSEVSERLERAAAQGDAVHGLRWLGGLHPCAASLLFIAEWPDYNG